MADSFEKQPILNEPNAQCYLYKMAISGTPELYADILRETDWQQEKVYVYGQWHEPSRATGAYTDDPNVSFTYSGKLTTGQAWQPGIQAVKEQVETILDRRYNFALVNYYKDGESSIGWHSDDVKTHQPDHVIASVSLGATRDFILAPTVRNINRSIKWRETIVLEDADLLTMDGPMQNMYKHSVPKRKKPIPTIHSGYSRINITFRQMLA